MAFQTIWVPDQPGSGPITMSAMAPPGLGAPLKEVKAYLKLQKLQNEGKGPDKNANKPRMYSGLQVAIAVLGLAPFVVAAEGFALWGVFLAFKFLFK